MSAILHCCQCVLRKGLHSSHPILYCTALYITVMLQNGTVSSRLSQIDSTLVG